MKKSEIVAAGFVGVGVVIIIAGALLASSAPELRDAIHSTGLLSMLIGAGVFLLGRRLRGESPQAGRAYAPSGLQQTAKNLAIAGATFLVGSLAASFALGWVLPSDGLLRWILAGLGALGGTALALGAVGYGIAVVLEEPRAGDRRENSS